MGTWNLVDSTLEDINIGTFSAPAIYDLNGDNRVEMALGNKRGGLGLFKSAPLTDVGIKENSFSNLLIYPNPASNSVTIDVGAMSYDELVNAQITVYDLMGRKNMQVQLNAQLTTIDLSSLSKGTYLIQVSNGSSVVTKKLLLQ